jgi:uncharacterized protein YuzE
MGYPAVVKRGEILIQITGPRVPLEVTVDKSARAAYVRVRFGTVFRTIEHSEGVLLDVDSEGRLLGFEILMPANAQGIEDAADYYIRQDGAAADAGVPPAMRDAGRLLQAIG